jgi:hypothetical protein
MAIPIQYRLQIIFIYMIRKLLLLSLLCVCTIAKAQSPTSIENLYTGGQEAFYNKIKKELRYPQASFNNGRTGMALVSFTIDQQEGLTGIAVMNSIDPYIDEEVKRVLLATASKWVAGRVSGRQEFILPVLFARNEDRLKQVKVPAMVLKPVVVSAPGLPEVENSDLKQELGLALRQVNHFMANYQSDLAMLMLNELVRTNPFNKEIRETRVHVYGQMNEAAKALQERAFVERFLAVMDEEE